MRPGLQAVASSLWTHPRAAEVYPEYLIALHGLVRASVPLMEAARERAEAMASACPVAAGLGDYLDQHIEEERGHDLWLLEDLEALGATRVEVLARLPAPATARAVGAQYYWIRHVHPVALLGYIAVLEGRPPTLAFLDEAMGAMGLPPAAFRTLAKHAHLDPGHGRDLRALVDRLPLEPRLQTLIGVSALDTVAQLAEILAGVAGGAPLA